MSHDCFEGTGRSLASSLKMAERKSDDSIAIHCGRCGTLLNLRLEDLKDRWTVDCDACEQSLPIGKRLPVPRSSRVSASPHAGAGAGVVSSGTPLLLDEAGNPLSRHLQRALGNLAPKVRHRFPALGDELLIIDVLEEAGRRIAVHERVAGPVDPLAAYAWVTVLNVARSRLRHSSMRLVRSTLGSQESHAVFGTLPSTHGAPEHIEAYILIQQVVAPLTPEEQWLVRRKLAGYSSREIAQELGTSALHVNTLFYRAKRKIRHRLRRVRADTSKADHLESANPGTDGVPSRR
jgi:RNA polymerase sigma factor (sigma-70 family)